MIDTHCHLTFPDFEGRVEEELEEASRLGVTGMITISTTVEDAARALAVARMHERVWCAAGVHPLYADQAGPSVGHDWDAMYAVASDARCVAWGELGLDNHYKEPEARVQRAVLEEQLEFIQKCSRGEWRSRQGGVAIRKPVVVHCREAFDDLIPVLRGTSLPPERFVFHCFTGTPADVRKVLDFGASVSFTGVATYRNAAEVKEAARLVPADRVMVETDAPFLAPDPMRGRRPCRPAWTRYVAESLAATRGEGFDAFHEQVNRNTRAFFGVDAR
ncbi:MAG: TatD family hydrolase [Phycisphaeraceae bacterium]|nr:TatD family hydrolase [Phycisphaeraceae bacterium]